MVEPAKLAGAKPRLYHALSSYYSMIARLALVEGGIAYEPVVVDIHVKMVQQRPDYVRLNPNMTVPTLVLADRILDQSRTLPNMRLASAKRPLMATRRLGSTFTTAFRSRS
jgi:ganglioside-induced differentiation-associated protein 1